MAIPIFENGEPLEILNPSEFICHPLYFKNGHTDVSEIKLRSGLVANLRKVNEKLKQISKYQLKIYDGFRPVALQEKMYNQTYEKFKAERPELNEKELAELTNIYWAFPNRDPLAPPPHNTGGAVDLTLVDEENNEIEMGTPVDDLTKKAFTNYFAYNAKTEQNADLYHANRMLLKNAMEEFGFKNYPEEWWHFDCGNQEWASLGGGEKVIYGSAESR
ncbi:MAG: M15 family metallopeptidase [Patescibacteria group bacterium]